jgi:hypothetical protein
LVVPQSAALVWLFPSWAPSTIFAGLIPPREHFSVVPAFEPDCKHFWRLQVDAFFNVFSHAPARREKDFLSIRITPELKGLIEEIRETEETDLRIEFETLGG